MHLLNHDANVTLTNDAGMDCIATAEETARNFCNTKDQAMIDEWSYFIEELKRKEGLEKARSEARDRARTQANDE